MCSPSSEYLLLFHMSATDRASRPLTMQPSSHFSKVRRPRLELICSLTEFIATHSSQNLFSTETAENKFRRSVSRSCRMLDKIAFTVPDISDYFGACVSKKFHCSYRLCGGEDDNK